MADERPYQQQHQKEAARRAPVKPDAPAPAKQLPPISEAERERIAQTIADVKAHMPELVPIIKDLHAHGLIDGWRSVTIKREENGN